MSCSFDANIAFVTKPGARMGHGISIIVIVGALILGLIVLGLAIRLAIWAFAFATFLFFWAGEQGFVGIALFIVLWVIATPVMLTVCIVGGIVLAYAAWRDEQANRKRARDQDREDRVLARQTRKWIAARCERPKAGDPDYLDWANRTGRYSDS